MHIHENLWPQTFSHISNHLEEGGKYLMVTKNSSVFEEKKQPFEMFGFSLRHTENVTDDNDT